MISMFDSATTQLISLVCTTLISILPSNFYVLSALSVAAYFIPPHLPRARMQCLEKVLRDTDEMLRDTLEEGLPDPQFVRKAKLSLKRCAPVHHL